MSYPEIVLSAMRATWQSQRRQLAGAVLKPLQAGMKSLSKVQSIKSIAEWAMFEIVCLYLIVNYVIQYAKWNQ